jgi:hypothetical protein
MARLSKPWNEYLEEFQTAAKDGVHNATQVLKKVVSEVCEGAPDQYPSKEKALELGATNFAYYSGQVCMWKADSAEFLASFAPNEQTALLDAFEWAAPEKAEKLKRKPDHDFPKLKQ